MATKVFVGNLSFQTNNEQLREHFTSFGEVVSVNIITRGPRSLGYGFVELSSEEEANKAVAAMDQQTLDGRVVNVQIARPQVKREEGEVRTGSPKRTRPGSRRPRTKSDKEGAEGTSSNGSGTGERRRRNGARRNRARSTKAEGNGSGEEGSKPGQKRPGGAPRRSSQTAGARRAPRKNLSRKPRESSTTTLFVGNLPFSMEDAGLLELFSAHLPVKATIARKASQRSKGFGFVEFANEEAQKAALEAMTGKQVEGRDINLKIALQPIEKEEHSGSEGNSSSEAGAASSSTQEASEAATSEEAAGETKLEVPAEGSAQ